MNKRDLGDEIRNMVKDAFNNGNFKKLSKDIEDLAKSALAEAKKSINWIKNTKTQGVKLKNQKNERQDIHKSDLQKSIYTVPVGQVSGVLFTILGIIGSVIFGLVITIFTILGYTIGIKGVFHTISLGFIPLFIISVVSVINGNKIRRRLKRFQRYTEKMYNRSYCPIKDLSFATGLSIKATINDLKNMIALGMFPEGHIDDEKSYFILNNETYGEYLKFQEGLRTQKIEKQEAKKNTNPKVDTEVKKIIDDGRKYVMQIRGVNDDIPGEEISRKLDKLEELTGRIFDYVENHPEKLAEIKKFIEYFLPTTLKLLEGYKKLDRQTIEGQNISNAKKEIEDAIDTINSAFEKLLDDLFIDIAMDISTDISVLETILAQEGLTENDLRQGK